MSNAYGSETTKRMNALNPWFRRPEEHPRLLQAFSDVRSGRKTVDEAWGEWMTFCKENGLEPVDNSKPEHW